MSQSAFDREKTLARERYFNDGYFKQKQMDSMVAQLLCVHDKKTTRILEVGPGNGFVSSFLKSAGYDVTTFDINESLNPDVVGNLAEIEQYFEPKSFDLILCAEVLEHLPFEYFEKIIQQFKALSTKWVIVTLPIRVRILLDFQSYIKIPFVKAFNINLYQSIPQKGVKWKEHSWELNYDDKTSLKAMLKLFEQHFKIHNHYSEKRNRGHYFFELLV